MQLEKRSCRRRKVLREKKREGRRERREERGKAREQIVSRARARAKLAQHWQGPTWRYALGFHGGVEETKHN